MISIRGICKIFEKGIETKIVKYENLERERLVLEAVTLPSVEAIFFFLYKCPFNTIFYTPIVRDLKKKKFFLKIFIIFKKILVFSRFFPIKWAVNNGILIF